MENLRKLRLLLFKSKRLIVILFSLFATFSEEENNFSFQAMTKLLLAYYYYNTKLRKQTRN